MRMFSLSLLWEIPNNSMAYNSTETVQCTGLGWKKEEMLNATGFSLLGNGIVEENLQQPKSFLSPIKF